MLARITRFKMKPDSAAAARALIESLKADILALPGMHGCINVMNEDGSGYVISLIDDAGTSPESVDRVRAIWHKFHDHVETMASPEIFEVISDWRAPGQA
jgi:hypothetical protein